jgi:3-deoxy-D-manno-octulosonic-acid transferase
MPYLLNLVYLLTLAVASPWLAYRAWRKKKYREGFAAKLFGRVPHRQGPGPCIWLHAVSVGEVNVLGPLLSRLEAAHPTWECVISTTTKTGFDLARRKYAPRTVFYCPLDFSWAVRNALRRMRPDLLVLTELELWPNLILAAERAGIPVAIVNGRLSERSFKGYRRIRPLVNAILQRIDVIAVQSQAYADRFLRLGAPPDRVVVTGSIKFDGAETCRDNPATRRLAKLAGFRDEDIVFLAGSTQAGEEVLALATFRELVRENPRLRLVLTPRHPERFAEVVKLLEQSGLAFQQRSRLEQEGYLHEARILLVDAVGELGWWWGTAQIAFVGGSLGDRGGQNMIEPAGYGAAVCFGPNTANFRDVVAMLLERSAATVVADGPELTQFVRHCLESPDEAAEMGGRARSLVLEQRGAALSTCQRIERLLGAPISDPRRSVA